MVLDGNIPVSTIDYICSLAKKHSVPGTSWALKNRFGYWDTSSHNSVSSVCVCVFGCVSVWYEPTDADKACKPFVSESWKALSYTSPNLAELCTINQALCLPTPQGTPCYQPQMVADNWCWNYVLLVPHHIVLVWCSGIQTDTKKPSDDSFPVLAGMLTIKLTLWVLMISGGCAVPKSNQCLPSWIIPKRFGILKSDWSDGVPPPSL